MRQLCLCMLIYFLTDPIIYMNWNIWNICTLKEHLEPKSKSPCLTDFIVHLLVADKIPCSKVDLYFRFYGMLLKVTNAQNARNAKPRYFFTLPIDWGMVIVFRFHFFSITNGSSILVIILKVILGGLPVMKYQE